MANIVDEIALKLGLPTSETLQVLTKAGAIQGGDRAIFHSMVNQGTDPIEATRLLTTYRANSVRQDPRTGGANGEEFNAVQTEQMPGRPTLAPANEATGQPAPAPQQRGQSGTTAVPAGRPRTSARPTMGPEGPPQEGLMSRLINAAPVGAPLQEILGPSQEAPIISLAKAFSNAIGLAGTARAQEKERQIVQAREDRAIKAFEVEQQQAQVNMANVRAQTALATLSRGIKTTEMAENLSEELDRQTPETRAKILRANGGPTRLVQLVEDGNIAEYRRLKEMYKPIREIELQEQAEMIMENKEYATEFGLTSIDDAKAFIRSSGAREVVDKLRDAAVEAKIRNLELQNLQKQTDLTDAEISRTLTAGWLDLKKEEMTVLEDLEEARAFQRIMTEAKTPEEQQQKAEQLAAMGINPDSALALESLMENVKQQQEVYIKSVKRFNIPGLVDDLLNAPLNSTETGDEHYDTMNTLLKSVGLGDPADESGLEDKPKKSLLLRASGAIDSILFRTFGKASAGFEDKWGVTSQPLSEAASFLGDIFRFVEDLGLGRARAMAAQGMFADQDAFQLTKQRIADLLARHGFSGSATPEALDHDAATIVWYTAQHPGEAIPWKELKLAQYLGEELQPPGAKPGTAYTLEEAKRPTSYRR